MHNKNCEIEIKQFYHNTNVFITGATGFLGKALLEKLLFSCDVGNVYILIRPKKGKSASERLEILLQNQVFDRIRQKDKNIFKKVKIINGDITSSNLGLTENDAEFLINNIDIVFHSAASVRFDETLEQALIMNTFGTIQVMELCNKIKQLKSFVHVSTAFSNCDKTVIDEIIYDPICDPDIAKIVKNMPKKAIDAMSVELLKIYPNTYTVTKAMAEYAVFQRFSSFPVSIVRPSVITSAWKEPFPGWVSGLSGVNGILMETGCGSLKSIYSTGNNRMELIPVDIVVNTIITAAWYTSTKTPTQLKVYNSSTSDRNPITWKKFLNFGEKFARIYPSKYTTWNIGLEFNATFFMHHFYKFFYSFVPSAVYDVFFLVTNRSPVMLRRNQKFYGAMYAGRYFAQKEWKMISNSISELIAAVDGAKDGNDFEINVNSFKWQDYMQTCWLGIRKYILKDDLSSLEPARSKVKKLYWLEKVYQLFCYIVFFFGLSTVVPLFP